MTDGVNMAGWMEMTPNVEQIVGFVSAVVGQMETLLEMERDLEGETFTVEVGWKYNPLPIKNALEERLHDAGVEVEVDIYPVDSQSRWDLMTVCVGTMCPRPSLAVG